MKMKSNKEQLEKRGFLAEEFDLTSFKLSFNEKINLLKSNVPTNRTLASRLLKNENDTKELIQELVNGLKKEKKLYPKIEIANTLVFYGKSSVIPLIELLGKIGTNQHKIIPEKEFKKDSYPLPRDIASRTLAHIGKAALPGLLDNFETLNHKQQLEAIDAIGFICFYDYSVNVYELLKKQYLQDATNELTKWKIIRTFSGCSESKTFLETEYQNIQNNRLKKEIKRSLSLLTKMNFNKKAKKI